MSHLLALHRAHDGPIPPALLDAARAADRAADRSPAAPPAPHRCRLRLKAWKPAGTVARMAASLIEGAERRRAVGARWLTEHGFSADEIAAHGPAAVALAARLRPDLAEGGA